MCPIKNPSHHLCLLNSLISSHRLVLPHPKTKHTHTYTYTPVHHHIHPLKQTCSHLHFPITLTSHSAPVPAATGSSLNYTANTTCWLALTRRWAPDSSSPPHKSPLLPKNVPLTDTLQICYSLQLLLPLSLLSFPFLCLVKAAPYGWYSDMVSAKWQSVISDRQMELFLFLFLPFCPLWAGLVGVWGGRRLGDRGVWVFARVWAVWKGAGYREEGGVRARWLCN